MHIVFILWRNFVPILKLNTVFNAENIVFLYSKIRFIIMIQQVEFTLKPATRGFHLITQEVVSHLPQLPDKGLLHLFVKHTSCGLCLNENADPDVRYDLETIFDKMVPERTEYYRHTLEGSDDMPSHAKSVVAGASITIPISRGKLNMGVWQGIYLCEFRDYGGARKLVVTIVG